MARRARDEARRQRILDPSQYANGADQAGLAAQVAEKQAAAAADAAAAAGDGENLPIPLFTFCTRPLSTVAPA